MTFAPKTNAFCYWVQVVQHLILPVSEGSIPVMAFSFTNCELYYTESTMNAVSVQFTLVGILVFQRGLCYHAVRETTFAFSLVYS